MKQTLRGFIIDELNWRGSRDELTDHYALIDNRIVDSLGIFNIVSFVEERFDVEIQDDELVPKNFNTIESIANLVETKRASRG